MEERRSTSGAVVTPGISERERITRICKGERALFHELVRPYERAVYITAYSILRNPQDAEDAAQETMLKALTHLHQLQDDQKFKSWLLQIAVNEARLRQRKDHSYLFEPLEKQSDDQEGQMFMPRDFADWREVPSEAFERSEIRRVVNQALAALPEIYREVFLMRDVEHLGTEETATSLGISRVSVKVRLHRARLQVREQLAPFFKRRWTDRLPFLKGRKPW